MCHPAVNRMMMPVRRDITGSRCLGTRHLHWAAGRRTGRFRPNWRGEGESGCHGHTNQQRFHVWGPFHGVARCRAGGIGAKLGLPEVDANRRLLRRLCRNLENQEAVNRTRGARWGVLDGVSPNVAWQVPAKRSSAKPNRRATSATFTVLDRHRAARCGRVSTDAAAYTVAGACREVRHSLYEGSDRSLRAPHTIVACPAAH